MIPDWLRIEPKDLDPPPRRGSYSRREAGQRRSIDGKTAVLLVALVGVLSVAAEVWFR